MEDLTTFMSSRGLLKSCDAHNRFPASSSSEIDSDLVIRMKENGSVYLCTDALQRFVAECLPTVASRYTLVTGDSDMAVTENLLTNPGVRLMLDSERLTAWYAQNLQASHPKLHPLPIGMDYHTMWNNPWQWGMTAISPIAQENMLLCVHASSPAYDERYLSAYCNWHLALNRGDRKECLDRVDQSACFFEAHPIPRGSSWQRQSECMFVTSPEGVGMDCHRTWEALLLGCIPIVKRNSLSTLFRDLPVMVVDDWSEVNKSSMRNYYATARQQQYDFSPLFLRSWTRKLGGAAEPTLAPMGRTEFRKLLTRKTG